MTEALGTRGEFRLLHKIGEGGMADVFLAERLGDDGFRTRVALKRLHRGLAMDSYFIRQLVREARLLGQLEHNNIVKVFDLRRIGDEYYVVMEYVDGIDLAAVIKVHRSRKTRIPRPFFFHVALSLTEALAYAHNAVDPSGNPTPLIHRDIKPSNVMLSRRGIVKLTDFGIAHVGDGSVTGGLVQGTANYMSPEQAFGEERLTGASDVYSLGSVFYEMLTGRPLIDGDNYLKAIHQVRERRVSVEELAQLGVEPGLRVVMAKMLSADATARYGEMDNVRNDLQFVADRLKIDLSWHRIRAYVGRLMGILGRAPDRATLSNVGLTAMPKQGAAEQLGPQNPEPPPAPAPAPPPPLPEEVRAAGPPTPPTPVPRERLERKGPVTQAVQKDLLESYIAMAQLESTSENPALPTATAQGLTALPEAEQTRRRDPLDAATVAAPPPRSSAHFATGTPVGQAPAGQPPSPPPAQRPLNPNDWDADHTRVYDGPTPAQSGVYGTGEMRAYQPAIHSNQEKTRPLPGGRASMMGVPASPFAGPGQGAMPPAPPPAASSVPPQAPSVPPQAPSFPPPPVPGQPPSTNTGRQRRVDAGDLDDPTRFYAGPPPAQTSAGLPVVRGPSEAPAQARQSGAFDALAGAPSAPARRRPKRTKKRKGNAARGRKRRGRRRRKGVPPNVIGALVIVIIILLALLLLLLAKKYGPASAGIGNISGTHASIKELMDAPTMHCSRITRVRSDRWV